MKKPALCIPRSAVSIDFASLALQQIPTSLFHIDAPVALVDRSVCETDESLLQFIPYIVLYDKRGKIFCYERGTAGGEDRLHSRLSIGLGGHVDGLPLPGCLKELLLEEGERELLEEVGVTGALERFTGLIYTGATGNAVDKVHLGLLAHCELTTDEPLNTEVGIVEKGRFLTLTELLLPETFERLELWSQVVVNRLREMLSEDVGRMLEAFGQLLYTLNIESSTGGTSAAAQETGSIAAAVGANLVAGHANARIYDDEEALANLAQLGHFISNVTRSLGAA